MKNEYEIHEDYVVLFVKLKKETIETKISLESLEHVKSFQWTWTGHFNKWSGKTYVIGNYITDDGKRKQVKLHRFITNAPNDLLVDHVNHDTLDNRLENLNFVTKVENAQNRNGLDSNNKSGVRGVYWNKQNKTWRARVKSNGKNIEIGSFKDLKDAEIAINEARLKLMPYLKSIIERG